MFTYVQVMFTIDVRSKDDSDRETNVVRIEGGIHKICRKRGVRCSIERKVSTDTETLPTDRHFIVH